MCHFCIVRKSGLAEKSEGISQEKAGSAIYPSPSFLPWPLSLHAMVIRIRRRVASWQFQIVQSALRLSLPPTATPQSQGPTDMPLIRTLSILLVTGHSP